MQLSETIQYGDLLYRVTPGVKLEIENLLAPFKGTAVVDAPEPTVSVNLGPDPENSEDSKISEIPGEEAVSETADEKAEPEAEAPFEAPDLSAEPK